jgi:hypothetical protein
MDNQNIYKKSVLNMIKKDTSVSDNGITVHLPLPKVVVGIAVVIFALSLLGLLCGHVLNQDGISAPLFLPLILLPVLIFFVQPKWRKFRMIVEKEKITVARKGQQYNFNKLDIAKLNFFTTSSASDNSGRIPLWSGVALRIYRKDETISTFYFKPNNLMKLLELFQLSLYPLGEFENFFSYRNDFSKSINKENATRLVRKIQEDRFYTKAFVCLFVFIPLAAILIPILLLTV